MWNYGWKPFFIYIGSSIILFMFVCCFVIDFFFFFVGWRPQLFTSFVLFLFIIFQLKANSSCSNTQNLSPTFRCQDSKACHRRFNAKSNVHSMNNIRAPETFLISVCYRICFSAVRACSGSSRRERLTAVEADFLYEGCILHRPQSCAFFYAIEHKHTERETIS